MKKKNILVLGADGMVGSTVFSFLAEKMDLQVTGTSRMSGKFYFLEINSFKKDLTKIVSENNPISVVINCIGNTDRNPETISLIKTNSLFPQQLAEYLQQKKIKLIHISSDAVFGNNQSNSSEETTPSPNSLYGASKLLGEPCLNTCVSIRTSILGLNNFRKNGLLEWARSQKSKSIDGYSNHMWSGCTSLQLGIFCYQIIKNWSGIKTNNNRIIHFAPIKPVSKYDILVAATKAGILNKKIVKRKNSTNISRFLVSEYFDNTDNTSYTFEITKALLELSNFKNNHE